MNDNNNDNAIDNDIDIANDNDNYQNESSEISLGELVWAKIDGYPWWPSVILEVKTTKEMQPLEWTVAFLGEKNSYQHLTRQKIKKWTEISLHKTKYKKLKSKTIFLSAISYGNYINLNELTYDTHHKYIEYLETNKVSPGEQGVKQFKEQLDSGQISMVGKKKSKKDTKSFITNELDLISNEMDVIKKNMNIILSKVPPDQLIKQFSNIDFSNSETLYESSSIDNKMALLNYLECLCQMFKIPYETNQTLSDLIKKLDKSNNT